VKPWNLSRLLGLCGISVALWAIIAALCLVVGSTHIGLPTKTEFALRWPNVMVASIIGAALSAAGVAYQAVLRNVLAEPYLLGVSSGASLFAYLSLMATGPLSALLAPLSQQTASFIGSMAALVLVLALSQRRGKLQPVMLVLVGVIVSSFCGAAYLFVYHLNLRHEVSFSTGGALRLLVGGINTNLSPGQIKTASYSIAIGWVVLMYLSGQLNVAVLSEEEAHSLGVNIDRLRWIVMIAASLMTAAAVALSGPIGFIGLICPNLLRVIVGPDQRRLLPLSTALGAGVLALADAISRGLTPWTSGPLPVGVLTGILGGPFFLFMLWRRKLTTES
jgi:iron complex transport system permease protein